MNKIYYIRKQKVMLDRDLAELYDVQAIRLREQVKRNIERFPANFMFRHTEKEAGAMVSQNAISSRKQLGGYLPLPAEKIISNCIVVHHKAVFLQKALVICFVELIAEYFGRIICFLFSPLI
ncbi:MAG: ORF6N domain-containing protein [Chitinophagaceae bacterium]|nr:ORF6N domain-containing protein [Chitinophagaceae bacterium]